MDGVAKEDYSVTDSVISLKAECDLKPSYSEVDVFKEKLPLIEKGDFDFVKCEHNTISTAVIKCGHKWDFKHVKHLCGSGKLYVRLNGSNNTLVADDKLILESYEDGKLGKGEAVSNVGTIQKIVEFADKVSSQLNIYPPIVL